jgi:hypothetical protein
MSKQRLGSIWPVCVCEDCIRCGCNQPWYHHDSPEQCVLLQGDRHE